MLAQSPPVSVHGRTPDDRARRALLERGGAEMRRARRYRQPLGVLVITSTLPLTPEEAALDDATRTVLEAATRLGVDQLIRLNRSTFAALLPNTPMAGVLRAGARLKTTIERLTLADGTTVSATVGYGGLAHSDTTFAQILARVESQLSDRS